MDALRAQMARQGYAVPDLTPKERERVWYSLVRKRRRAQLTAALHLDEDEIDALVARVRQDRARRIGHR
jgi:hypothetical protein